MKIKPDYGTTNISLEDVLSRLEDVTERNGKYRAPCPAHGGVSKNSLSVTLGDNGKLLVYCHATCSYEEIMSALDLWEVGTPRP
ncbi:MAG: hypothetical protein M3N18_00230, partial [Actinomycetota bacterium]|nr:hypothetical protein [Actinomycetota bacterium]